MSLTIGKGLVGPRISAPPAATPYLDALPLTLNCRPGGVTVTGNTLSDDVAWLSRASAGSSAANALFRHGNNGGGTPALATVAGSLNGMSTLVIPFNCPNLNALLSAYDAAHSTLLQAADILGTHNVDSSNAFTMFLLTRFGADNVGGGVLGLGDSNNGRAQIEVSSGVVADCIWFGNPTITASARPAPAWQLLWLAQGSGQLELGVNRDVNVSAASGISIAAGAASNPFYAGPFNAQQSTWEIGGVWAANVKLTQADRFAIIDELRTFTGEALA